MNNKGLKKLKQAYDRLSSASFADPFSFLGPYLQEEGIALRVWMPGADGVAVELASGERLPMVRDEASGFVLKSDLDLRFTHYQLAVDWNGTEQMLDDPYQYHALYAEYDELHPNSSPKCDTSSFKQPCTFLGI